MGRAGLNCTLSYPDSRGITRVYQVRAGAVGHGIQMIYGESAARTARAFYPHRTAMQQFSVVVLLKNWDERRDFVSWLSSYANYAIDPDIGTPFQSFPWMQVSIPSRGFIQSGVPLTGYEWGAHTGMMMFTPRVVFESAQSPGSAPSTPQYSTVINKWSSLATDPANQYFYPFSTQLSGTQTGQDYVNVSYNGSPAAYNTPAPNVLPNPDQQQPPSPFGGGNFGTPAPSSPGSQQPSGRLGPGGTIPK
jgi:hypothetical protein